MKIKVETPFCEGYIKVETGVVGHPVIINLNMHVKRVAKFSDYENATKAAWDFSAALGEGPYPGECELRRVSQLLEEHLGILPLDQEE